jgi:hypothetical protein
MYVVHTSALPEGCELRVAPTGTAGTIRLDQVQKIPATMEQNILRNHQRVGSGSSLRDSLEDVSLFQTAWGSASNEYEPINEDVLTDLNSSDPRATVSSFSHLNLATGWSVKNLVQGNEIKLLARYRQCTSACLARPASSTDAWFILNLLSAVPFLTSLSYASTMEVLETARVDAYCKDEIIVPAARRNQVLCVVWEGTCVEREKNAVRVGQGPIGRKTRSIAADSRDAFSGSSWSVSWHAGDWTGPIALQPEKRLEWESQFGASHDVVAMSMEGVRVCD